MINKKRLISVLLLLVMMLSSVGCTKTNADGTDQALSINTEAKAMTKTNTEGKPTAKTKSKADIETEMVSTKTASELSVEEAKRDYEQQVWDYLMEQYENEYAAAAVMANSTCEMSLYSYRYESDTEIDEDGIYSHSLAYTEKVDSGEVSRSDFIYNGPNGGGYGMFSWTGSGRKGGLYDYASERGCSIADWKMQLDYAYQEIIDRYYGLYVTLLTAENVREATEEFAVTFENTANPNMNMRMLFAKQFLEEYGSEDYSPKYKKGDLLPVNHSYDYMAMTFREDTKTSNIYIYIAQCVLKKLGYILLEPSGIYGYRTTEGISRLQEDNGLEGNGILSPEVWKLLKDVKIITPTVWKFVAGVKK